MTKTLYDYDVIVSIDIGITGGITFLDTVSGEILSVNEMPTMEVAKSNGKLHKVIDLLKLRHIMEIPFLHNENAIVVLENVHPFPFQGAVSVGTLMEQKGIIRGMVSGLGYDEYQVQPKTWQKFFGMVPPKDLKGKTATKTTTLRKSWLKEKSLQIARETFTEWKDTKLSKSTAHGLSDSMLLGQWFLLNYPKESPL